MYIHIRPPLKICLCARYRPVEEKISTFIWFSRNVKKAFPSCWFIVNHWLWNCYTNFRGLQDSRMKKKPTTLLNSQSCPHNLFQSLQLNIEMNWNSTGNTEFFLSILIWKLNGHIDWGIFYCAREIVMNLCVNARDEV